MGRELDCSKLENCPMRALAKGSPLLLVVLVAQPREPVHWKPRSESSPLLVDGRLALMTGERDAGRHITLAEAQ